MNSRIANLVLVIFVSIFLLHPLISEGQSEYILLRSIPDGLSFCRPVSLAIDNSGNIYALEKENAYIQKIAPDDRSLVFSWGEIGTGESQFTDPEGIAVDSSGNVYVADSGNCRIQKFDSNGNVTIGWGQYGNSNGQFSYPNDIAIDASGNVYVLDSRNCRIQEFDSKSNFLIKWGANGSGNGQFKYPTSLALDSSGNIYVTDADNHRIQKFDTKGNFLTKWGTEGDDDGQFRFPSDLAVDGSGNVYVVDSGALNGPGIAFASHRVQKFDSEGKFLAKWGVYGSEDGQFSSPDGIVVDKTGNVYVADTYNNRIQKFDPNGKLLQKIGICGSEDGHFRQPYDLSLDSSGNLYVADTGNHRIQKFDPNDNFLTKWGTKGASGGQFERPSGITVDRFRNVFVVDAGNYRIQKFDSEGNFLKKWGRQGNGDGEFDLPYDFCGICADKFGNVYVIDYFNNRVQKFDSNGSFPTKLGTQGADDGQLWLPHGIAVDESLNIYITDANRIQKFDSNGVFKSKWPMEPDLSSFSQYGITIDNSGDVFATDGGYILKFDSNGKLRARWGSGKPYQLQKLYGIAADVSGNIYVADAIYSRILVFSPKEIPPNSPPKTPTNIEPENGMTNISMMPTLKSSEFSDPDPGDSQRASQWQITNITGNYDKPVYDSSIDTKNLISIPLVSGILVPNTTYYWRVRYQDSKGAWSVYSSETRFTTSQIPIHKALIDLYPGINIVSLPLNPGSQYTASSLAEALGATIVIRAENGKYDAYVPKEKAGTNFPIEMGKGYIVNILTAKTFEVTGLPWGVLSAPPVVAGEPWAFVFIGRVNDILSMNESISITNIRTGKGIRVPVQVSGDFIGVFVDMNHESVVSDGDEIAFQLISENDIAITDPKRYIILNEQISNAYLPVCFSAIPERAKLYQNYPNPFNPETWIPFQLSGDANVKITISNSLGISIRTLNLGYKEAGIYMDKNKAAYWDGKNDIDEQVSNGIYFYTIQTGKYTATGKMLLLR